MQNLKQGQDESQKNQLSPEMINNAVLNNTTPVFLESNAARIK